VHWNISPDVEAVLWSATQQVLPPALCSGGTLRQAVLDRSRRYTEERVEVGAPLSGREHDADLAAHALFFAPADAAKILIPLAELHGRNLLPAGPLRILDVGAGPGAMTLGALDFLHRIGHRAAISVHAVDRDRDALRIFRQAVSDLGARLDLELAVTIEQVDLAAPRLPTAGADLILIGSVLNELAPVRSRTLLTELLGALDPTGALIVIEPALRETARALHELRDFAVTETGAHVFAPCVRQAAPCPALEHENDWCHEDRPVQLPERTAKLAANTGLRSHGLKFAYLVLRRAHDPLVPEAERAARVVSHPRRSKGKRECFACSENGREPVRLLKRNRSAANRDFERVRRGDVLIAGAESAGPPAGDLTRTQHVIVRRPAGADDDGGIDLLDDDSGTDPPGAGE
jgi:ribosomal protein RSM22 (predicted rRNA methylase)